MSKIEGWEKVSEDKWIHKELDFNVILDIDGVGDNYWITKTIVVRGPRGGIKSVTSKTLEKVKGKTKVLEFAIDWMRKHKGG